MSIGTGIVLFVIGAILEWALNISVSWIDLHMVGWILMIAGAIIFVLGLIFMLRRRRSVTTNRTMVDPEGQARVTRQSTSTTPDDEL
ncbi:hypothetical protein LK09_18445 [Microbacterium mangrovi]|uniref:DUF6458 domain-containing protein n=1 Tax=Microbacterium mangrovi TaxID=1348253 RepID=A0A0B1ZWQ4_9MICO|nr:DUF6458 family protein [Microbacterium mangrovi]KHK95655.1 hypothetical protein LK09_18445 [Microbacterium mangrovi]